MLDDGQSPEKEIVKVDLIWVHRAQDRGNCEAVGNTLVAVCVP